MVLISLSSLKNLFVDVVLDYSCDAPVFVAYFPKIDMYKLISNWTCLIEVVEIITLNNMIWK